MIEVIRTPSASPNGKAKSSAKGFQSVKGVLDSLLDSVIQTQRDRNLERDKEQKRREKQQEKCDKERDQEKYYILGDKLFDLRTKHIVERDPQMKLLLQEEIQSLMKRREEMEKKFT